MYKAGADPGGPGGDQAPLPPHNPWILPKAPQHFSSMSEEEEEERRKKNKKKGGGRKKKGK